MLNNVYLPHLAGGSINTSETGTLVLDLNFSFNFPIVDDPRKIISIWNEDSMSAMDHDEIFIGLQIYCLADNTYRVCRWIPLYKVAKYNMSDCVWDKLHTDDVIYWQDITTMTSADISKSIESRIQEKEQKYWRMLLKKLCAYWGFYNFNSEDYSTEIQDDSCKNTLLNNLIISDLTKYVNGEIASRASKNKEITLNSTAAAQAFEKIIGSNLIIITPSDSRELDYRRSLTSVSFNGVNKTFQKINDITLLYFVSDSTDPKCGKYDDMVFDIYVVNDKLESGELNNVKIYLSTEQN